MAAQLIQQAVSTTATGNGFPSLNFGASLTAGNSVLIVVSRVSGSSYAQEPNVTDEGADATLAVSGSVTGVIIDIYYKHNMSAGGNEVLWNLDSPVRTSMHASEWKGIEYNAPTATNSNTGIATSTVTTNPVTKKGGLVIAAGGWTADNYSSGPTNGFTRMTQTGGTGAFQEEGYLILSSHDLQDTRETGWTLTAGINWAAVIAKFSIGLTLQPPKALRPAIFMPGLAR